jgi:hypothetical protein
VDVGILAPVLGVVLAVIVVLLLWRVMRVRASKSAARMRANALSESEAEFLDSSHIISGGTPSPDLRRKSAGKPAPPVDRIP